MNQERALCSRMIAENDKASRKADSNRSGLGLGPVEDTPGLRQPRTAVRFFETYLCSNTTEHVRRQQENQQRPRTSTNHVSVCTILAFILIFFRFKLPHTYPQP
eukprot:225408-Rhodomonas_salina.1